MGVGGGSHRQNFNPPQDGPLDPPVAAPVSKCIILLRQLLVLFMNPCLFCLNKCLALPLSRIRMGTSHLHELYESNLPFVIRIEFIRSKSQILPVHVSADAVPGPAGITAGTRRPPPNNSRLADQPTRRLTAVRSEAVVSPLEDVQQAEGALFGGLTEQQTRQGRPGQRVRPLLGVAGRHRHRDDDGLQQDDGRGAVAGQRGAVLQLRLQSRQQRHLHQRRERRTAHRQAAEGGTDTSRPKGRRRYRRSRLHRHICRTKSQSVHGTLG